MPNGKKPYEDLFVNWANNYLRNFYMCVIDKWGTSEIDQDMWAGIIDCAEKNGFKKDLESKGCDFVTWDKFKTKDLSAIKITSKPWSDLRDLIEFLYKREMESHTEHIDSLLDAEADDLEIVVNPSFSRNKMNDKDFSKSVIKVLSHGKIWKTTDFISGKLKVSIADFDDWALKRDDIQCKNSENTPGVFYYALKTRLNIPEFGSEKYKKYILSIFEEDDKKWKSTIYLAEKVFCDQGKFEEWVFEQPDFCTRPSSKNKGLYYICPLSKLTETESDNNAKKEPDDKKPVVRPGRTAKSVSAQELYAIACLHNLADQYVRIMNFYGNKIAVRDPNIVGYFARSQKDMTAGIALLKKSLGVKDSHLPDIEI